MKEYTCHVAQKGFYAGPVYVPGTAGDEIRKFSEDPAGETAKLMQAIDTVKKSLENASAPAENSQIMETVSMMLDDDTFIGEIRQCIRNSKYSAEYAVKTKCREYTEKMENASTEYLRARAEDISGLGVQLINVMRQSEARPLTGRTALVAPEISPAQMSVLDSRWIGGIITDKGAPNSHLSILAGNLEIPYLYGNPEAVAAAAGSSYIIIDGDRLISDPDEPRKAEAEAHMICLESERKQHREAAEKAVCKTRICANIAGPEDIPQLLASGADGVGLFRSEFLFLGKETAPTEEEQFQAYRSVLEAMGDKEVIIRTMDLGSDKQANWLALPEEANPALGLRGVRVSLEKKEVFNSQLRALLRAGVSGHLKIMFPMITSELEIDEIRSCVETAAAGLEKENIPYVFPELGIMIETPAAAVIADILSKKVSFFSIGTNDLTQYTLALDREARGLDKFFDPHCEAVFRLIETVIREGHKNHIPTGICGQLAADPEAIERLIAAGVDELSVPVSKVTKTRSIAAKAEGSITADGSGNTDRTVAACAVLAPADGELIAMNEIPDPVFSSGQLGECIGILPNNGSIFSPCNGTILHIAETRHAVTIRSDNGEEYLLHIGIDTVRLGGKGFDILVREGEHVSSAQKIMEADLDLIKENGYSTIVIMVRLVRYG